MKIQNDNYAAVFGHPLEKRLRTIERVSKNRLVVTLVSLVFGILLAENSLAAAGVTEQVITVDGQPLKYTANVGIMPIHDKQDKLMATMSYFAYHKIDSSPRPVTFVWAGGPGNSSLPNNFLVSGPKIIDLAKGTTQTNPDTWLRFTDLVYIDMVGTGWGRVADSSFQKEVFSPKGDAYTFCEFIKTYLMNTDNQQSGVYLAGESYGGYRAPLVANQLMKSFTSIEGIILQSPLLKPSYSSGGYDPIMSYILAFPTFVRTAIYYEKLAPELLKDPEKTIEEGVKWALHEYPYLLMQGNALRNEQRNLLVEKLNQYTGLSKESIRDNHFRISMSMFRKHILQGENKVLDYTNAKMSNFSLYNTYGFYVFTMKSVMDSLTSLFAPAMHHVATELNFKGPNYYVSYFDPGEFWNWENQSSAPEEVVSVLRDDLIINDQMRLFVGVGFYDTDIPYMLTTVLTNQIFPEDVAGRMTFRQYDGGHMFALEPEIREQFSNDIRKFFSADDKGR